MDTYLNTEGVECVVWTDENGAMHSMTKVAYDEQQADEARLLLG